MKSRSNMMVLIVVSLKLDLVLLKFSEQLLEYTVWLFHRIVLIMYDWLFLNVILGVILVLVICYCAFTHLNQR